MCPKAPSLYAKEGDKEIVGERASGLGPKGKERTGLKAQGFARYWEP